MSFRIQVASNLNGLIRCLLQQSSGENMYIDQSSILAVYRCKKLYTYSCTYIQQHTYIYIIIQRKPNLLLAVYYVKNLSNSKSGHIQTLKKVSEGQRSTDTRQYLRYVSFGYYRKRKNYKPLCGKIYMCTDHTLSPNDEESFNLKDRDKQKQHK